MAGSIDIGTKTICFCKSNRILKTSAFSTIVKPASDRTISSQNASSESDMTPFPFSLFRILVFKLEMDMLLFDNNDAALFLTGFLESANSVGDGCEGR